MNNIDISNEEVKPPLSLENNIVPNFNLENIEIGQPSTLRRLENNEIKVQHPQQ